MNLVVHGFILMCFDVIYSVKYIFDNVFVYLSSYLTVERVVNISHCFVKSTRIQMCIL